MEEKQGPRPMPEEPTRAGRGKTLVDYLGDAMEWVMTPPVLPAETRRHLYAARREFMLATRSLLDRNIERLEQAEHRQEGGKSTKIPVD